MKRDLSPPNSIQICHLEPVSLRTVEAASLLHHRLTSSGGRQKNPPLILSI